MRRNQELIDNLTNTLNEFIANINDADPSLEVYEKWNVHNILEHITFWHKNYAENLEALESGLKPPLLGTYKQIAKDTTTQMGHLSKKELIRMLIDSNNRIISVVNNNKVKTLRYKKGSRMYTVNELLEVVEKHIGDHLADLKKIMIQIT